MGQLLASALVATGSDHEVGNRRAAGIDEGTGDDDAEIGDGVICREDPASSHVQTTLSMAVEQADTQKIGN